MSISLDCQRGFLWTSTPTYHIHENARLSMVAGTRGSTAWHAASTNTSISKRKKEEMASSRCWGCERVDRALALGRGKKTII